MFATSYSSRRVQRPGAIRPLGGHSFMKTERARALTVGGAPLGPQSSVRGTPATRAAIQPLRTGPATANVTRGMLHAFA